MLMTQRRQVPDSSGGHAKGASKPSLGELRDALRRFAAERDWDQFHFPKNLAIALSIEAGELLEHFQWVPDVESAALPAETRAKVREELADVLLYLIRLADKLDIDLEPPPSTKWQSMPRNIPCTRRAVPVRSTRTSERPS